MNQCEIKKHIINFLSNKSITTVEIARQCLIRLRSIDMEGYTSIESHCLWFSLFLYKFRSENNVPDSVWTAARKYILSMLSPDLSEANQSARYFLTIFKEWKKEDNVNFAKEVIDYYIQVLHLKQIIEETRDENTIGEWNESYQELLTKIRDNSMRMGFLPQLDAAVEEINREHKTVIENTMKRAYWDLLEENIRNKEYAIVMCQLLELKNLIKEIIPSRFHEDLDDKFNLEYIQDKLEKEMLEQQYLIQLCRWIMNSMKEWDSEATRSLYDREIKTWENSIKTLEWPRFIRFSIELCTLLALDAKTRVSIWRSILEK